MASEFLRRKAQEQRDAIQSGTGKDAFVERKQQRMAQIQQEREKRQAVQAEIQRQQAETTAAAGKVAAVGAVSSALGTKPVTQLAADQARKNYESYTGSAEAKKKQRDMLNEAIRMTLGMPNGSVADAPLSAFQVKDTKAEELKARAQAAQDAAVMEADLKELERWPEEDKAALEKYIIQRNQESYDFTREPSFDNARYDARALFQKYGAKKIQEMAESYARNQNAQNAENAAQAGREGAGNSKLISSVASVGANAIGNVTGTLGRIGEIGQNTGRYSTLDPNNVGSLPQVYAGAVREQVASDIEGEDGGKLRKLGATVYQAGMSAADSLARAALGGGNKALSLGLAASGSYSQTVSEASKQGATPAQAVLLGVANAGLETATEYIPLDNLLKAGKSGAKTAGQAFMEALKQAGMEATTEEISYLGSLAAEAAILREKSSYNQQIGDLVANGMSYADAVEQANKACWEEAKQTFFVSALSGGMTSGVQTTVNKGVELMMDAVEKVARRNGVNPYAKAETAPKTKQQLDLDAGIKEFLGMEPAQMEQKNTAQNGGAQYRLREYTQHEKENWKNSKRIVLYESVDNFRQFIKNALTGPTQTNKKMYFGAITSDLAKNIANATGVNVDGYNLSLGENEIRKINKSHGNEKAEAQRGQRAVTEEDYLNIPNVVQSADNITLSPKQYEGKPVIEFRKTNGNEMTTVAGVVSDKRLDLFVQTTFINKKTGSIATPESVQADSFTPKATGGTAPAEVPQSTDTADPGATPKAESTVTLNRATQSTDINSPDATPEAKPVGTSTYSIPEGQENVNGNSGRRVDPEESVGAAPLGFDPFSRMQYDYGNIPDGENPVRPDDMPVSTDGNNRVSYTARTVKGAAVTPDAFAELIDREVTKGGLTYIPITNNETVQKAVTQIQDMGWAEARAEWSANVRAGKTGADMAATGALLLNNAANAGDKTAWLNILDDYRMMGTNTAQGLQALRILKTLAPDDQLYMINRSVRQMVKDMHLNTEITIDEDLQKAYREAETDEQRDKALKEIQKDVASQIPSTFSDKWTALRYLNMLGNFRTQIRNITGNIGAKYTYLAKDEIAAALESVASAVSGGKFQRTKSMVVRKGLKNAAAADFDTVKTAVLDGGKYSDSGRQSSEFAQGVQDQRRIFKSDNKVVDTLLKPLEGYRKATNWAMNTGDIVFAKGAYARALAGYLQANGVQGSSLEGVDNALLDKAREYAIQQAQEATFRDNNMVSGWISKVGRRKDTPKAARAIAEGIMPFRKTPANVLVRAEEFSPLGFINSAVKTVQAAQGKATGAEVINSWAKTMTGTGLFILGAALGDMGYLVGGPDEDEDKQYFDELNGYQNYAIQLPDGTNLTIDFLSPSAMPMFLGAQWAKILDGEGYTLKDFESVFTSLADPLIEMSMLQGVNDTIDAIKYSDNNLGQFLLNATMSYLTQGLTNTLMGQLERSTEESRMTTYVDKGSDTPAWLQRQLGKISQKVPIWDYQQMEYRNAWGETERNPEGIANWLYNLLSPSYVDKVDVDAVAEELYRLNEVQSDVNVFPDSPESTITYRGKDGTLHEDYSLSAEEMEQLQITEGQTQARIVAELVDSKDYAALTDAQKAKAVSLAYDYAREHGRVETLSDYDGYPDSWMQGIQNREAAAIINKVAAAEFSDAMNSLTESWREGYDPGDAVESLESAYQAYKGMSTEVKNKIKADASGRLGYFLTAKSRGMSTDTFVDLYQQYYDLDQSDKSDSEKAADWSYTLQRAQETKRITQSQKEALKDSMVFYQMFPAETEKFDQMVESGISADDAQDLGWLLNGIAPQEGYKTVRDVQKAEAIAESSLSEADKIAALRIYGSDAQDENLDQMLSMGFSAADYVAAYRMYSDASGDGKKRRTIAQYQKQFGVDYATAKAIYEIYGG